MTKAYLHNNCQLNNILNWLAKLTVDELSHVYSIIAEFHTSENILNLTQIACLAIRTQAVSDQLYVARNVYNENNFS